MKAKKEQKKRSGPRPFDYFEFYKHETDSERLKRLKGPIYKPNRQLSLQLLEHSTVEDKVVPTMTKIHDLGYVVKFTRDGRHFDIVKDRR